MKTGANGHRTNTFAAVAPAVGLDVTADPGLRPGEEALEFLLLPDAPDGLPDLRQEGVEPLGLRHVLNSLERAEVQSILLGNSALLMGNQANATVVECTNCGHLDYHLTQSCAVCGQPTRELIDIADALIATAVRNGIEVLYIEQNPELEKLGHIAALLRFRADQSTNDLKQAG